MRLWIDNESARFALISGYSTNPWAARIVSEIWVHLSVMDCTFFVERVPTKENIADGPSRGFPVGIAPKQSDPLPARVRIPGRPAS